LYRLGYAIGTQDVKKLWEPLREKKKWTTEEDEVIQRPTQLVIFLEYVVIITDYLIQILSSILILIILMEREHNVPPTYNIRIRRYG
jgi:hypothetical protein